MSTNILIFKNEKNNIEYKISEMYYNKGDENKHFNNVELFLYYVNKLNTNKKITFEYNTIVCKLIYENHEYQIEYDDGLLIIYYKCEQYINQIIMIIRIFKVLFPKIFQIEPFCI